MVLQCNEAVGWGSLLGHGVKIHMAAVGASATVTASRPLDSQMTPTDTTSHSPWGLVQLFHLIERTAGGTQKHIVRVPLILCNQIAGYEVHQSTASDTRLLLDPKKVLDWSMGIATMYARSLAESAHFFFDLVSHPLGKSSKTCTILPCSRSRPHTPR